MTVLGEDDGLATEKWVSRFQETSTVDFFLVDPQVPGVSVFVPGIALGIRKPGDLECKSIITTCDNLTSLIASTEEIPIGIRSIASKNRFNLYGHSSMFSLKKKVRKVMRYQIFSFLVDEQVAMLGIVSDGIGPAGEKMMTLSPVRYSHSSTLFFLIISIFTICLFMIRMIISNFLYFSSRRTLLQQITSNSINGMKMIRFLGLL